MKTSTLIETYREELAQAMIEAYRTVIRCDGRIQVSLYMSDDGSITTYEAVQGDRSWLANPDLRCITIVSVSPSFSIWDASEAGEPDDPQEAQSLRDEIEEFLMDSYREAVDEEIDNLIEDYVREEKFDELDKQWGWTKR